MSLRERLRRLPLPDGIRSRLKRAVKDRELRRAFAYDRRRYLSHSSSVDMRAHRRNLRAVVTERYHSIEKGLSLPAPRPGFGTRPLGELVGYVNLYLRDYGADETVHHAAGVIRAYLAFSREAGVPEEAIPYAAQLDDIVARVQPGDAGGTLPLRREQLRATTDPVGLDFFTSRHSTRQFSTEPVAREDVEWATRAAQASPAVCNRQFAKVHAYLSPERIAAILAIQGGARGFEDQVRGLAVITTTVRSYWDAGQRNQGWVDGGLFAMSFLLGLHARGLGSVALNWTKPPEKDRELRSHLGLDEGELVVMLVAFGRLRPEYTVASSPRLPLWEALEVHD